MVPLGSDMAGDTVTETLSWLWGRMSATALCAMERGRSGEENASKEMVLHGQDFLHPILF